VGRGNVSQDNPLTDGLRGVSNAVSAATVLLTPRHVRKRKKMAFEYISLADQIRRGEYTPTTTQPSIVTPTTNQQLALRTAQRQQSALSGRARIQSSDIPKGEDVCGDFPNWQRERNLNQFGPPEIVRKETILTRLNQEPVIDFQNQRQGVTLPKYHNRSYYGSIGVGAVTATFPVVIPAGLYDTIDIAVFDSLNTADTIAIGFRWGRGFKNQGFILGLYGGELYNTGNGAALDLTARDNFVTHLSPARQGQNHLHVETELTNAPFSITFYLGQPVANALLRFGINLTCKER
jgi:hypothetical protein